MIERGPVPTNRVPARICIQIASKLVRPHATGTFASGVRSSRRVKKKRSLFCSCTGGSAGTRRQHNEKIHAIERDAFSRAVVSPAILWQQDPRRSSLSLDTAPTTYTAGEDLAQATAVTQTESGQMGCISRIAYRVSNHRRTCWVSMRVSCQTSTNPRPRQLSSNI